MVSDQAYVANTSVRPAKAAGSVVLVVEADRPTRELIVSVLQRNGYDVLAANNAAEALAHLVDVPPDLIIADATITSVDGANFLQGLRADGRTNAIPFILITALGPGEDVFTDLSEQGDAYIVRPVRPPELVARVGAMLTRTKGAAKEAPRRHPSSALNEHAFEAACRYALDRVDGQRLPAALAYIELFELAGIRESLGHRGEAVVAREIALLANRFDRVVSLGIDGSGRFMLLMLAGSTEARDVLNGMSRAIVAHRFHLGSEPVRLTPIVGFAMRTGAGTVAEMRRRAALALGTAESHLDLQAVRYSARLERVDAGTGALPLRARVHAALLPLLAPFQFASTFVAGVGVPFLAYWFLAAQGADITGAVYVACVTMLLLTAVAICWENLLALKVEDPPSAEVYPPASAVIAAYLPNEAATIIETIEAFLRADYPADLQIILAYNTPRALPMEEELQAIAARDPRFVPLRVHGSTSKAQNVNAALRIVRGAFVGVFDADHKPDPDSFTRAWNWLANGYDVVQGHCLIRNGDASPIARLVAIEFESIYAVSHPGRARMHGFGLFGGSNGYWKTDLLRQTRMHSFMLTEDIDSSLRVLEAGYRIASDPKLISRELAPLTLRAIWHQRLRWAQGWFQVSLKHLVPALRSPHLTVRQKAGMLHLLLWRECYVWICVQILPILAFWTFVRHDHLSWAVPIFLVTTILTALTGPLQLLFTFKLADPEIRRHRGWFLNYLVMSILFFSEFKNVIGRLGHIKEAMRERTWKVTPRSSPSPSSSRAQ